MEHSESTSSLMSVNKCQQCRICRKSNMGYNYLSHDNYCAYHNYEKRFELTNELIETIFAIGFDFSRLFHEINERLPTGETFLIWCAYSMKKYCGFGQKRVIDLIKHAFKVCPNIDINAKDTNGCYYDYTALHYAAIANNEEFVKLLLDNNIDKNTRAMNGKLAIDLAKSENIRKLLL